MITNVTKLELDFDERKYILYCDSEAPIEHVRVVLGAMSDKLREIAIVQELKAKQEKEQQEKATENLPVQDDCCQNCNCEEKDREFCNGKTLC